MLANDPSDSTMDSTIPEMVQTGSRGGIAAGFAYASIRERLFPDQPRVALKVHGRYTLLSKLGEGTSGVVFAAFDRELDRKVALKVLRTAGGPTGAAHLLREARSLARLSHAHVVQVHDAGETRGEVFVAMEFIAGEPLDVWIARTRPTFPALLDVFIGIGQGLAAAHAEGIIHRDLKPANILVDGNNHARIVDFGLAWSEHHDPASHTDLHAAASMASTAPGVLSHAGAGTPAYMSPEQCDHHALDPRSDLFSYCVVLWEAVHGARPFLADTTPALMLAISAGDIRPVTRPSGVPARLEKVLRRGLARAPDDRHQTMATLLAELERIRNPPHRGRWLLAIGVLAGLSSALIYGQATAGQCMRNAADIDAVWSPERSAALLAGPIGQGPGAAAAHNLARRLDDFTGSLKAAGTATCEQHDDGALTQTQYHRAQQCLAGRARALRDTAALFSGDPTALLAIHPDELTAALGDVERCRDITYLSADIEPPAEADRPAVADVDELRHQGEAELLRGQFVAAARTFERAVTEARAVAHAPTTAAALYDLARTYLRLRRSNDAEPLLREARALADSGRDDFMAADAAFLLFDNAIERHALAEAEPRYTEALAKLHRIHRDHGGPLGELELARVGLLLELHRPQEAADALARAERGLASPAMPPGLWQVTLWRARAALATLRGDPAAALDASQRAQLALRELYGSDEHPLFATERAKLQITAGRLDEAAVDLARAADIYERTFGPDSPQMAEVHTALARLYHERDDQPRALAAAQRADTLLRQHPDDPMQLQDRVTVAMILGHRLRAADRVDEAITAYGRGITSLTAVDLPAESGRLALLLASRADLLRQRAEQPGTTSETRNKLLADATSDSEAALARLPAAERDAAHDTAIYMLRVAADVGLARGDLPATRRHAEDALALLAAHPRPGTRARVEFILARALGRADTRAQQLAAAAAVYFTSVGQHDNAAEVQRWAAGENSTAAAPPR